MMPVRVEQTADGFVRSPAEPLGGQSIDDERRRCRGRRLAGLLPDLAVTARFR
jgi:hypothetical protein